MRQKEMNINKKYYFSYQAIFMVWVLSAVINI